jgi:hypothetical protein
MKKYILGLILLFCSLGFGVQSIEVYREVKLVNVDCGESALIRFTYGKKEPKALTYNIADDLCERLSPSAQTPEEIFVSRAGLQPKVIGLGMNNEYQLGGSFGTLWWTDHGKAD